MTKAYFLLMLLFIVTMTVNAQQGKRIVVAQDGSGDYKTVQAAFDAVPVGNKQSITIFVKDGIYKEKLHLDSGKNSVILTSGSKFNTILTYDDHTGKVSAKGDSINTRSSHSFLISAYGFFATNITFQNDAGFTAGQAVAVECDGDRPTFIECRFLGNQDVLFMNNDKATMYFRDCYIEGTTDFIFGSSTAWFERCHIHSKKNSHITAASTPIDHKYGFVFYDCTLTGDSSLHAVSLGRPWRQYASVAYVHCYIGQQVKPEGWSNWNKTENYKTTRFSEYANYGPGAGTASRVKWAHQLTEMEGEKVTYQSVWLSNKPAWIK